MRYFTLKLELVSNILSIIADQLFSIILFGNQLTQLSQCFIFNQTQLTQSNTAYNLNIFFYQNIDYNVQTNNLQSTKINQNNMIKMSQTINITLQPMQ